MMRLRRMLAGLTLILALAAVLLPATAHAVIIPLSASMDGAQANAGAGTGSPGTGSASITLDTATNLLSWSITWSSLMGTPIFTVHLALLMWLAFSAIASLIGLRCASWAKKRDASHRLLGTRKRA